MNVSNARPDEIAPTSQRSRYIPSKVREQVLERAGYRCEFVTPGGGRCEERTGLHIDHVLPFGKGGSSDASNLRALCCAHNRWQAVQDYGEAFMRARIARDQARRGAG